MNTFILNAMMERMQRQTVVDLVQLPYLRAVPRGQDIVRILKKLDSSSIEGLRLPVLHVPQLEALDEFLLANPSVRMISVQELSSDMAYSHFFRAMALNQIHHLELGRSDRMSAKDMSIVGCNALACLLEKTQTLQRFCLTTLRLIHPEIMARGIAKNQTLRFIKLCNVQMENFSFFLRSLECLPLESLWLEDMEIDVNDDDDSSASSCYSDNFCGCRETSNPWAHLPQTLQQISITECSLCTPEVEALCDGLLGLSDLAHVTLSTCDLLPTATRPLCRLLNESPSLESVNLEQNLLGTSGATEILSCASKQSQKPLELNLQSNNVRDVSSLFGGRGISCSLDLSDNPLGPSIPLMIAPSEASLLKKLQLSGCCLTDSEIVSLCKVITLSVAELGLANNVVHEAGAEALRTLLDSNPQIASLDLSSCHIDDATIGRLLPREGSTSATTTAGGLKDLYLAFNKIQNGGISSIAKYLKQSACRLRFLNLQFNDFDGAGLRQIESALSKRNTSLCHLYFWSNKYHQNRSASEAETFSCLEKRIDHWLALNKAGRSVLPLMSDSLRPKALWAPILAHADRVYGVSAVFYLLKNRPDLLWDR